MKVTIEVELVDDLGQSVENPDPCMGCIFEPLHDCKEAFTNATGLKCDESHKKLIVFSPKDQEKVGSPSGMSLKTLEEGRRNLETLLKQRQSNTKEAMVSRFNVDDELEWLRQWAGEKVDKHG
jgi:hypothetical protein